MSTTPRTVAAAATLAAALLTLLGAVSTAAAHPAVARGFDRSSTTVLGNCSAATVAPRKVMVGCRHGNRLAVVNHYDEWTDTEATGRGLFFVSDCQPTCADGTWTSTRATFRLHRVVGTSGGPRFNRLEVTTEKDGRTRVRNFVLWVQSR